MQKHFSRCSISTLIFIALIYVINTKYIYAGEIKGDAESYRVQGYNAQQVGEIDEAISWYQKSASLDPNYAAPHNDLGILFEAKGWLDRAETEYQKAVAIDGNYANAHTNLALLYERKGELEKAAFHWMRRYKLGSPQDPWTQEAEQRLVKLGLLEKQAVSKKRPAVRDRKKKTKKPVGIKKTKDASDEWTLLGSKDEDPRKTGLKKTTERRKQAVSSKKSSLDRELQESLRLAEERLSRERGKKTPAVVTENKKPITKEPESGPSAKSYYVNANSYFAKGEYSRALDVIRSAKREYPDDASLLSLEESVKKKMKEERIKDLYDEGLMRYRENNFSGARKEFEAILNILPE
ncbi:MAG: tetratricopeptide repeat protein [Candidatus Omnitrophica bacterium]|nr:tetratricopeptide repeat protein [Candidatus Omnitrophota bacterium]